VKCEILKQPLKLEPLCMNISNTVCHNKVVWCMRLSILGCDNMHSRWQGYGRVVERWHGQLVCSIRYTGDHLH